MGGHEALTQILRNTNEFEPFLRHVRFPSLKNLQPELRIDFSHPVTALVGANGTNKSTILRAIQSCVHGASLGDYWFGTSLDTIDLTSRPRVIHGWNPASMDGVTVEVLKQRVQRDGKPDYWETAKPNRASGIPELLDEQGVRNTGKFQDGERSNTRWNPIPKSVVYLDFRAELSAFDKFFYHAPFHSHGSLDEEQQSLEKRRSRVRAVSSRIQRAIDEPTEEHSWYGRNRVISPACELDQTSVDYASEILGRKYTRIRHLQHSFFPTHGYTVLLQTDQHSYSEAFAGSGEFAVVRLIDAVRNADPRSLILLDEPEVSLHPLAQRGLLEFLINEATSHKHQIVMATHSSTMVEELPPEAIKVLEVATNGKVTLPSQASSPATAFVKLGQKFAKRSVVVEDRLAGELVERGIIASTKLEPGSFQIVVEPGGSSSIKKQIATFSKHDETNVVVVFDGDENSAFGDNEEPDQEESAIRDPILDDIDSIPKTELGAAMTAIVRGAEIKFELGSSPSATKVEEARFNYLRWWRDRVWFLPGSLCPDRWLAGATGKVTVGDSSNECKAAWAKYVELELYGDHPKPATSDEIFFVQRRELTALLQADSTIAQRLAELCESLDQAFSS